MPGTINPDTLPGTDRQKIQAAVSSGPQANIVFERDYTIDDEIVIPPGVVLNLFSAGYRSMRITQSNGAKDHFRFLRGVGQPGVVITGRNLAFTGGKAAFNIEGASDAAVDNWLKLRKCHFMGMQRAVRARRAGQFDLERLWCQNLTDWAFDFEQATSFIAMDRCVNLAGAGLIRAFDAAGAGLTNGFTLDNCASVFSTREDAYFRGVQEVDILGGGFDLGAGGAYSIRFEDCQEASVTNAWVASHPDVKSSRDGISYVASRKGAVFGNSINNNRVGVYVSSNSKGIDVLNNNFEGSAKNDVIIHTSPACAVRENKHFTVMPRVGTDFEIYTNFAGTTDAIVSQNRMKGGAYTIAAGANSIVDRNLFGCAL